MSGAPIRTTSLVLPVDGERPMRRTTGIHCSNTVTEMPPDRFQVAARAISSHGWTVEAGTVTVETGNAWHPEALADTILLTAPDGHEELLVTWRGGSRSIGVSVGLGALLTIHDRTHAAFTEDGLAQALDQAWRRVPRLHALSRATVGLADAWDDPDRWHQSPQAIHWATFPDRDTATPWVEHFGGDGDSAHRYFTQGLAPEAAAAWSEARVGATTVRTWIDAGWTPTTAAVLRDLMMALPIPERSRTWQAWRKVVRTTDATPDQVILGARAGLDGEDFAHVHATGQWDAVAALAALRT